MENYITKENKSDIIKSLKEIKVLIDVMVAVGNNNLIFNELMPGVKNRLNGIYEKISTFKDTTSKHPNMKRFDVVKEDGTVELGLLAPNEEELCKIFCDEKIQILREIDECGMIIKENERRWSDNQLITPKEWVMLDDMKESTATTDSKDYTTERIIIEESEKTEKQIKKETKTKTRRNKNDKNTRKSRTQH
jgi:hypothetical protein